MSLFSWISPGNRSREEQRSSRREKLYGVVRESMTRAGVLTTGYKFKVLSLDSLGRQFVVMVDLASERAAGNAHLGKLEAAIVRAARARHDIGVSAVYWRANEEGPQRSDAPAGVAHRAPERPVMAASGRPSPSRSRLAGVAAMVDGSRPRRATGDALLLTGFEDTEDPGLPLGGTQYGELK